MCSTRVASRPTKVPHHLSEGLRPSRHQSYPITATVVAPPRQPRDSPRGNRTGRYPRHRKGGPNPAAAQRLCRGRVAIAAAVVTRATALDSTLGAVAGARSPPPSCRRQRLYRRSGRWCLDGDTEDALLLPRENEHPRRHGSRRDYVRAAHSGRHPPHPQRTVHGRRQKQEGLINNYERPSEGRHSPLV